MRGSARQGLVRGYKSWAWPPLCHSILGGCYEQRRVGEGASWAARIPLRWQLDWETTPVPLCQFRCRQWKIFRQGLLKERREIVLMHLTYGYAQRWESSLREQNATSASKGYFAPVKRLGRWMACTAVSLCLVRAAQWFRHAYD